MQMHYAFLEVRKIRLVNLYHNGGNGHKPNKTFVKYIGLLPRNKNILTEFEFFSAAFCEVSKRDVFVCAYFAASLLSDSSFMKQTHVKFWFYARDLYRKGEDTICTENSFI